MVELMYRLIKKVGVSCFFISFIFQKILRYNGKFRYFYHFTSRIRCPAGFSITNEPESIILKSCLLSSGGLYLQAKNGIIIDSTVFIAPGVKIISSNHDINNLQQHSESSPVTIHENVWIGANSIILPGVVIGPNSIIGAGSVVTKSIPQNVIAVGNPCKVVKSKK